MIALVPQAAERLQQHFDDQFEPGPVLLEQRVQAGGRHTIRRVIANGEVWVRSTDAWGPHAAREPANWVLQATLPRDELAALSEGIAVSGFFECAPEYRPDRAVAYAANQVWTAHLGGRQHTVSVRGRPITDIPAVSSVADVLSDALADAAYG